MGDMTKHIETDTLREWLDAKEPGLDWISERTTTAPNGRFLEACMSTPMRRCVLGRLVRLPT
jgi:hypothetical protein